MRAEIEQAFEHSRPDIYGLSEVMRLLGTALLARLASFATSRNNALQPLVIDPFQARSLSWSLRVIRHGLRS